MQKCTLASMQHDMTAHFDRMYPATTAILGTKYGVDESILLCINRTISQLHRNVETALGTSDQSYFQIEGEPYLGGMVQGKADVPQWSTQQSDAMLKAHKALTDGVTIHSPNMQRDIRHSSIGFADDTDGQESTPTEPTAIVTVARKLEHSAQTWSNLVQICGGLIALHKCNWQLIAWELHAGHLKLVQATDERILLDDGNGSFAVIDFLPPHLPNIGLGYRICPDGSQKHHFDATFEAVTKLCRSTTGAYLTEVETRQLLRQRLLPKITYALHATSFSETECNKINSVIRSTFLPLTRLNRHFPSAVLYGPTKFGGLDFPEVNSIQDHTQVEYLIKQLRWDKTVANTFLVTLDNVQLCSGFITPILEHTHAPISYLEKSYIVDLRRRLGNLDATIWVEKAWTPSLQRMGDMSLMERFLSIPRVTRSQLRQANAVRLYIRVITIADLCDTTGRFIPNGMLNGDFQAGSDLLWPYQPCPPKSFFATFRKLLRQTFCTNTPIHHHHKDSMDLDRPLGRWLPVPRNTWSTAYRTENEIYWRPQDDWDMHVLRRSPVSGFFHFSHKTRVLPLDSHPIQYRQIGESIWTQRPYRIQTKDDGTTLPPGHIIENTLSDPNTEIITIGSDGSVYLKDEVAACAWMIAETEESRATACFLLGNISSLSSYRSELEGIFRSLQHVQYLGMKPNEIHHWCDNESAVNDSNKPLNTPAAMIKPDADIILAIHHLREVMSTDSMIICKHIYGHQDSRPRDTPSIFRIPKDVDQDVGYMHGGNEFPLDIFAVDNADLLRSSQQPIKTKQRPLSVTANIEADRLASETATIARIEDTHDSLPLALLPPYGGSRALLKIGDTWITSNIDVHLHSARWTQRLRVYCLDKYNWSNDIFDSIDWGLVRTARKKCTQTQMMQTSKIMHDWLPVMHMFGHITGLKRCPACAHPDETLAHLFQCTHPALVRTRTDSLQLARKKGRTLGLPPIAVTAICGLLTEYYTGREYVLAGQNHALNEAINAQRRIGLEYLPRGFLAMHWQQAIEKLHCDNADRKLAHLLFFIWTEITLKIWTTRNDIVHHGNNLTKQAEESRTDRQLRWYKLNHQDVLARTDFRLTYFDADDLHIMTLATKKERLRQLEVARKAHILECKAKARGQHTITRYFTKYQKDARHGDDNKEKDLK